VSGAGLVIIAKAPAPGRSKTRLCPPCTQREAASLAEAALRDTIAAVLDTPCRRRILALEGEPGDWLAPGLDVVPQRGRGLAERLASALAAAGGPALVVGMDTPQLTPELLEDAAERLMAPEVEAILGPALDGGYWTLGLREPGPEALQGVPMSSPDTCAAQRRRLRELGLRTAELAPLRDVDTFDDAVAVAAAHPSTSFAQAVRRLAPARHTA
jgi:rSAM/selenodomain-associated transferase 1